MPATVPASSSSGCAPTSRTFHAHEHTDTHTHTLDAFMNKDEKCQQTWRATWEGLPWCNLSGSFLPALLVCSAFHSIDRPPAPSPLPSAFSALVRGVEDLGGGGRGMMVRRRMRREKEKGGQSGNSTRHPVVDIVRIAHETRDRRTASSTRGCCPVALVVLQFLQK
jgi:hypothetical protein